MNIFLATHEVHSVEQCDIKKSRENKLLFQVCVHGICGHFTHIKSVFQFVGICVSSFFLYDDIGSLWLIWTVYIDSVFTNIDSLIMSGELKRQNPYTVPQVG